MGVWPSVLTECLIWLYMSSVLGWWKTYSYESVNNRVSRQWFYWPTFYQVSLHYYYQRIVSAVLGSMHSLTFKVVNFAWVKRVEYVSDVHSWHWDVLDWLNFLIKLLYLNPMNATLIIIFVSISLSKMLIFIEDIFMMILF